MLTQKEFDELDLDSQIQFVEENDWYYGMLPN